MKSHIKKRNNKPQSNLDFKMMSFCFSIRDRFKDPINKIKRTTIRVGDSVLDYGCGSGSYSIIAAEMVGPTGKVFSADIHPLAIKKVSKKASKKGLKNIDTILTDCATYLEDNSIDVIICFDTLHALGNLREHMLEFYRVLKPDGSLSVDDIQRLIVDNADKGITLSIIGFGLDDQALERMKDMAKAGKGKYIHVSEGKDISNLLIDEVKENSYRGK